MCEVTCFCCWEAQKYLILAFDGNKILIVLWAQYMLIAFKSSNSYIVFGRHGCVSIITWGIESCL